MQESSIEGYGLAFISCNDPYSLLMQWYAGTDYTVVALFYPSSNGVRALLYNVYDDQTPFWSTEEGETDFKSIISNPIVSKVNLHSFPSEIGEVEIKRYRRAILSLTLEKRASKDLTLEYHKELLHSLALGVMGLDPNSGYNRANSVIKQSLGSSSLAYRGLGLSSSSNTQINLIPTTFIPSHLQDIENPKSKELSMLLSQAFIELLVEDGVFASKVLNCRRSMIKMSFEVSQLGMQIQRALDKGVLDVKSLSSSYNSLARGFHLPLLCESQTPFSLWVLRESAPKPHNYLLPFSRGEGEMAKMGDVALSTILSYLRDMQSLQQTEGQGAMINAILEEQGRRSSRD